MCGEQCWSSQWSLSGWVTASAIREWAHPGFLLIIQKKKLIKVKGKKKLQRALQIAAESDMKNVVCHGFSSSLLFLRLTFLSPYVMPAARGFVVIYEFCWVVCALFYVVASFFTADLCTCSPPTRNVMTPWIKMCVTLPQLENKPYPMKYALWWLLDPSEVQFRVAGVRSRIIALYALIHRTTQPVLLVHFQT